MQTKRVFSLRRGTQLYSRKCQISIAILCFANLVWRMLSIGKIARGQHEYYERQVARGEDDYHSGRGEPPGEWTGAGAKALGLAGRVSAEQFNALIAGNDPRDPATRLRSTAADPKVAAFDLTFSAPKSVSVLFAIASADSSGRLVACHEEVVKPRSSTSRIRRRACVGFLDHFTVTASRFSQRLPRSP